MMAWRQIIPVAMTLLQQLKWLRQQWIVTVVVITAKVFVVPVHLVYCQASHW